VYLLVDIMRKEIIIGIVILIVLTVGSYFIFFDGYKVNKNLEEEYTILKNEDYRNSLIGEFGELDDEERGFELDDENKLICSNGSEAEQIKYLEEEGPLGYEGGWKDVFIVDCGDKYWVWEFPGFPGNVYGPFVK